jgi:hypothetical protein
MTQKHGLHARGRNLFGPVRALAETLETLLTLIAMNIPPPLSLRKYLKIIDAYEHVANILMQGNLVCKIDLKRPVK